LTAIAALAWARLRYRPLRWLLVAVGVALATALPVLAQASAHTVAARAVAYGVSQLDPGDRSLLATISGIALPPSQLAAMDTTARQQLATLTATAPRAEMLFHRLADRAGSDYLLGAADNLGSGVRITSGRRPQICTPTHCEVVVVGNGTPDLQPALGLVIVGRAVVTDPLLFGGPFDPGHDSPLLVANGTSAAAQLEALSEFQRQYAWVAPVDLDRVRDLGVGPYLARSATADDNLARRWNGMQLTAPDSVLSDQQARAELSTRRFALLSGSAIALLLGFAAVGAIGLRRDDAAVATLLRRRGVGRGRIVALTMLESAAPVIVGTVAGVLAGALVSAIGALGDPTAAALAAVRSGLPLVVVGAIVSWLLIVAVRSWPDTARASFAWRIVEAIVVAGIAVAGLALARGAVSAGALNGGTDPLLASLPIIAVVCGGLLIGRAWPALAVIGTRLLPRSFLAGRIGIGGAVRRPLRPVATAAFLAAATGCAVFAAAYQATLHQGAAEQAAFAVPLDATVKVGTTLVNPLSVGAAADFAGLAPGTSVHSVLRTSSSVRRSAAESSAAQVVGIDPAALTSIPSWNDEVGAGNAAAVATALRPTGSATPTGSGTSTANGTMPGMLVPTGTTSLSLPVSGDHSQIIVTAWMRTPDGRDIPVPLSDDGIHLTGTVPPAAAGATLFAFDVDESGHLNTIQQHHFGEGASSQAVLAGTVHLGIPSLAGASWQDWGSSGARATFVSGTLTVAYQFTGQSIVVHAGASVTAQPIPVMVDPSTAAAASGGILSLVVDANAPIPARVVAIAPRFPTVGAHFVVADATALANVLDTREPGTGGVTELWLSGPSDALAASLASSPYDQLAVEFRQDRQHGLATDPLAVGAARLLTTDALIGVLVAVLAVLLLVVAERRDEAAEQYAWESDGVRPATLRRSMFARAAAVVVVAVPGGLLVGLALSAITTRFVSVTAVGSVPQPPLTLAVGAPWALAVIGGGVVVGLLAALAIVSSSLREPLPRRPEEVLL
jgi:hypothetical protein